MVQRERHDRHRNLVVAATGTGKTVVAALDYRQLAPARRPRSLAALRRPPRARSSSRAGHVPRGAARRVVRRDPRWRPRSRPAAMSSRWSSRCSEEDVARLASQDFDVVDRRRVPSRGGAELPTGSSTTSSPTELLGLTATPERMDGRTSPSGSAGASPSSCGCGRRSTRASSCRFSTSASPTAPISSSLSWQRGGYAPEELRPRDHRRRRARRQAARGHPARRSPSQAAMRALGFCVSVAHARVHGPRVHRGGPRHRSRCPDRRPSPSARRSAAPLEVGELRCVFCVDVLGEGVDVPTSTRVLLLRPTDSATVFTQQLGRGLRRARAKPYLTVIDLIGQQHRSSASTTARARDRPSARSARGARRGWFPFLPSGCHDRARPPERGDRAREPARRGAAARNGARWSTTCEGCPGGALRVPGETHRAPSTYIGARTTAGRDSGATQDGASRRRPADEERDLLRALRRMLHIDDPERVAFTASCLREPRHRERGRRRTPAPAVADAALRLVGNAPHVRGS